MAGMPVIPSIPESCPKNGGKLSRAFGITMLRLIGWRVYGEFPSHSKMIIAVAPHTSNYDFFIGMFAKFALGIKANWIAKHSIFKWPVKETLTRLGGIPIDRSKPEGVVSQVANLFKEKNQLVIAVTPEGTRKKVPKLKTGFLRIAREANIPILLTGFDYYSREIIFGEVFYPSENIEEDERKIRKYFLKFTAKYPEQYCDWE